MNVEIVSKAERFTFIAVQVQLSGAIFRIVAKLHKSLHCVKDITDLNIKLRCCIELKFIIKVLCS